ncbi:MAG: hypothetical protein ACYC5N_06550 [Endomicrobiales bacterium]
MQRRLPWALVVCLFIVGPVFAGGITFASLPLDALSLSPSQPNVPLLLFSAVSDSTGVIRAVTVTYTGDLETDIAVGSVALYNDLDGDLVTPDDRHPLASGGSFSSSKARFSGLNFALDPGAPRFFLVTSAISASPGGGDGVSAVVSSSGDIKAEEAVPAGAFPLNGAIHHIVHPAAKIRVTSWKTSVVAGETVPFTVSVLDSADNVVRNYSGSTLSIGGAEDAPGTSPSGAKPAYTGAGAWDESERGEKQCSYTLYKAESGRKIAVTDDKLGAALTAPVTVSAASASSLTMGAVPAQTAGVPFNVTLSAKDTYGNPAPCRAGTLTTISAGQNIGTSPGGYEPVFPAAYTWLGTEPRGEKIFSIIIYSQCRQARLKAATSLLADILTNEFDVAPDVLAVYALSGPSSVRLQTKTSFTLNALDRWGNPLSGYNGTVLVSCSDGRSIIPAKVAVTGGSGIVDAIFRTWGSHILTVKDQAKTAVAGNIAVLVNQSPAVAKFTAQTPALVSGGRPFTVTITARDDTDTCVESYAGKVTVTVPSPASLFPRAVSLSSGTWSGALSITGETLEAKITVSDGNVTTVSTQAFTVAVRDYQKARAYPTVFSPRREALRIRYFLREDSTVKIGIYNAFFDLVGEIVVPSGTDGGRQGLNIVEWDGKGGDAGETGHSGAYHILIDKGYEKEWTEAVIKNF